MEKGEKDKSNGKNIKKILIMIVLIIIIALAILFLLIKMMIPYKGCDTWDCFNENLQKCSKAKFAGGKNILFGYTIEGKKGEECKVIVEYLQGDIASKEAKELENKKMACYTPINVIMLPESDLSNCNGELKEKLQEQIITRLHNYIIQNLGEINKGLLNPLNQGA